jgi:hypothetical protein
MFLPVVVGIIGILLWLKTLTIEVREIRAEMFCKRDRAPRKPRAPKTVQQEIPLMDQPAGLSR